MEKKITKRDRYNKLLTIEAVAKDEEMVSFIKHEIELLEKKNATAKKTSALDADLVEMILDAMDADKVYTVSEIMKITPDANWTSNQRASSVINRMTA